MFRIWKVLLSSFPYEWGTKQQFSQDIDWSSERSSAEILTLTVWWLRCIYSRLFCSSRIYRYGCELGAGHLGAPHHSTYGARLPLHSFFRAKVCTLGTLWCCALAGMGQYIQTWLVFNHFSSSSVCKAGVCFLLLVFNWYFASSPAEELFRPSLWDGMIGGDVKAMQNRQMSHYPAVKFFLKEVDVTEPQDFH